MRRTNLWVGIAGSLLLILGLMPLAGAADRGGRAADRDGNRIFDDLEAALERAGNERVDVIALFTGGSSSGGVEKARADVGAFPVTYEYRTIPGFAGSLTPGQVRSLAARPDVLQVELNATLEFDLDSARRAAGVDKARTDFPSVDGNNENSLVCPGVREYCKDDVVAAVIDSGVDNAHVDLDGGKVLGGADCSDTTCATNGWWNVDDRRHGTHVASILAGEGDGNPAHRGVAPGAGIVSVKVGGTAVDPTVASLDAGIEWVLANKDVYGIEVVNMSLSGTSNSDGTNSSSRLTNKLVTAGITPFAAGGNGGADPGKTSFPAAAEYAIAVGNMADTGTPTSGDGGGFVLAIGSRRGPTLDGRIKPDIVAHGVDVTAAWAHSGNGYWALSGTSMSSPFAAGVGALMLDANPGLVPSGAACPPEDLTAECADGVFNSTVTVPVKDLLVRTAEDWGAPGKDNEYGAGRIDGYAAVDAASAAVGSGGPAGPAHVHFSGTLAGTGSTVSFPLSVTSTAFPMTAAVIMTGRLAGATTPDFNVSILDAAGKTVAVSQFVEQNHRQENASFIPPSTGTYTVQVKSASGGGAYWLDVSFPGSAVAPTPTPSPTPTPTPTASPSPTPTPVDSTAPTAPTGVKASATRGKVTITWNASTDSGGSGLAGYKVYRATASTGPFAQIGTTTAATRSYADTAVTKGKTYWYYVVAYDNAGNHSAASAQVSVKAS